MRFVAIVVATALWMGAGSCANDAQNAAEAAGQAHSSLRMADDKEWLTPADEDWLELASHYGGAYDGGERSGKAAYQSLLSGGRSSFNAGEAARALRPLCALTSASRAASTARLRRTTLG
jgi:hypothetical protein